MLKWKVAIYKMVDLKAGWCILIRSKTAFWSGWE